MNVEVGDNFSNLVRNTQEFEDRIKARLGAPPEEGTNIDIRPSAFRIFSVPKGLLDELTVYLNNWADDLCSEDFDNDGELSEYHTDDMIDKFLRHFVRVYRQESSYNVTVEFTVDAFSEDEAEEKVQEFISWGADYNITETRED